MRPNEFDQYRSDTLWPEIAEDLDGVGRYGGTTFDYLEEIINDVPKGVASWCEDHPEALHIFTRYYPFSRQPVTLVMFNPRLDFDEDEKFSTGNKFPTLEHRRYAATDPDDVETLAKISAEHYNSYLYDQKGVECLLKRLGTVIDDLEISDSVPDKHQWDGDRRAESSKIGSDSGDWMKYFYNPDKNEETDIADMTDTTPPQPEDVLPDTTSFIGDDLGLSAQSPDLDKGMYKDFYITNLYKLGTPKRDDVDNPKMHIETTMEEVENAASDLVVAMGVPGQKLLSELGEPVYEPKNGEYSNPTTTKRENYGVVWKLNSEQYGLAVPHPSIFNRELGSAFSDQEEGWRLLSDALHYIESETNI